MLEYINTPSEKLLFIMQELKIISIFFLISAIIIRKCRKSKNGGSKNSPLFSTI